MDKNMINIDDLFRQGLAGGEHKEPAGSWSRMRELLDKEMPTEPGVPPIDPPPSTPQSPNWPRISGYLSLIFLLAAISVGGVKGYKIMSLHSIGSGNDCAEKANGVADKSSVEVASNHAKNISDKFSSIKNDKKDRVHSENSSERLQQTKTPLESNKPAPSVISSIATEDKIENRINGSILESSESVQETENFNQLTKGNARSNPSNNTRLITRSNKINAIANKNRISAFTGDNSNQEKLKAIAIKNPERLRKPKSVTTGSLNSAIEKLSREQEFVPVSAETTPVIKNVKPVSIVKENSAESKTAEVIKNDTIQKITLLQRQIRDNTTGLITYRVDTLAVEKQVLLRPSASGKLAEVSKAKKHRSFNIAIINRKKSKSNESSEVKIIPAATISNNAVATKKVEDSREELVPLADFKVASHKTYYSNPHRFQEMVTQAKYNLSQVYFYPGLVAGLNATMFGPNSMAGFQLGLSGVLALNDHYQLIAELKYMNRLNTGGTVSDNYQQTKDTVSYNAPSRYYQTTYDSVDHYFNFSTLHSIEMPIAVKYVVNRLYMLGGINLAFNFKVNTEEVDYHTKITKVDSSLNFRNEKPQISSNDFNSRFGIGYLLGIGYQFTPAMNVDLRVTQTMWDNANGKGAQKVSNQLFRAPSVQVNIGYRFSSKQSNRNK